MTFPDIPPPPRLELADSSTETPEDVEMEFDIEGISMEVPHLDLIITGEVCGAEGFR